MEEVVVVAVVVAVVGDRWWWEWMVVVVLVVGGGGGCLSPSAPLLSRHNIRGSSSVGIERAMLSMRVNSG
jgi:hypothetical protein